jgi:hypothetical protein
LEVPDRDRRRKNAFYRLLRHLKFFSVLKARPILGPGFSAANDLPGSAPVVIISYNLWKGGFRGDKEIIGRQVVLKPVDPATLAVVIIGILVVGFCAVFFPALRAIRTDPLDVLRNS